MFNPLSAADLTLAVGRVLKDAADAPGEDDYRRSQLLSGYSVARHLAAEQRAEPELRSWFGAEAASMLRAAANGGLSPEPAARCAAAADALGAAESGAEMGAPLAGAMASLRAANDPAAGELLTGLRRLLAEMCDREVAALAKAES